MCLTTMRMPNGECFVSKMADPFCLGEVVLVVRSSSLGLICCRAMDLVNGDNNGSELLRSDR